MRDTGIFVDGNGEKETIAGFFNVVLYVFITAFNICEYIDTFDNILYSIYSDEYGNKNTYIEE